MAAVPAPDEPAEPGERGDGEGREEGAADPKRRAEGAVSVNRGPVIDGVEIKKVWEA